MEITVAEAADALAVSTRSIAKWYAGLPFVVPYSVIDSEVLCDIIRLDHRFLMAWLVGYDIALTSQDIKDMLDCGTKRFSNLHLVPALAVPTRRSFSRVYRYSYRRLLPTLKKHLEKRNGKRRSFTHGTGALLPAPDALPPDTWTFHSAVTTEGTRLPRACRAGLTDGTASTLELPDRRLLWD